MGFPTFRYAAAAVLALVLSAPGPVYSQSGAGSYLAARQAANASDFETAAGFFSIALSRDPDNPGLLEYLTASRLALGQIEKARPVAEYMEDLGLQSQVAHMVVVANLIADEDYQALLARDASSRGIGPLVDGLVRGWSYMGAGSVAKGLEQFDAVASESGLRSFALYQRALALGLVGDFEGAEAVFSGSENRLSTTSRRAAIAYAQILSQLGRNEDALEMLAASFNSRVDPGLTEIADRLALGQTLPFDSISSVRDGMAEVFYVIGTALNGESSGEYALIYARLAGFLRPGHIDAQLLSAAILDELGQYELAVETYKKVPRDSPEHSAAELGRAEALRRAAKPDAAIEVLENLTLTFPTLPRVYSALGDIQRQQENYDGAIKAYDQALDFTEADSPSRWFLLYARGISYERLDQWDSAEKDFRGALALNPDQPQVLNYLGYSLVEKRTNLDEALGMIERAVAGRPDSGYIVDSLGWVFYRLGRFDEAVVPMEKAVELMPVDPVINDHLGDVYWAVGRFREAEFQWKRALSFVDPKDENAEADPDRMRRKLDVGLDVVLSEEGAAPLRVADDDG